MRLVGRFRIARIAALVAGCGACHSSDVVVPDAAIPTLVPPRYTLTPIDVPGTSVTVVNVGKDGTVVGRSDFADGTHAFRWRNGVYTDLGLYGGRSTIGIAVNDSGDIGGDAIIDTTDGMIRQIPLLWMASGATIALPLADAAVVGVTNERGAYLAHRNDFPKFYWHPGATTVDSTFSNDNASPGFIANPSLHFPGDRLTRAGIVYQSIYIDNNASARTFFVGNDSSTYLGGVVPAWDESGDVLRTAYGHDATESLVFQAGPGRPARTVVYPAALTAMIGYTSRGMDSLGNVLLASRTVVAPGIPLMSNGTSYLLDSLVAQPGWTLSDALVINDAGAILAIASGPGGGARQPVLLTPIRP